MTRALPGSRTPKTDLLRRGHATGAVLDWNLDTGAKIGGGTCTDSTAALQAYVNTASAAAPAHPHSHGMLSQQAKSQQL